MLQRVYDSATRSTTCCRTGVMDQCLQRTATALFNLLMYETLSDRDDGGGGGGGGDDDDDTSLPGHD